MENENDVSTEETKDVTVNKSKEDAPKDDAKAPTVDELMAELAQVRAEKAKIKNSLDKSLKEKGDLTKQLRAKMTAEEAEAEARAEADQQHKEYVASLERKIALNDSTARYTAMGMDIDMAIATAEAELDGDMELVIANVTKNKELAIKQAEAQWIASRPQVNAGSGNSAITKEKFNAMSIAEKSKLYRENPEEYSRLNG